MWCWGREWGGGEWGCHLPYPSSIPDWQFQNFGLELVHFRILQRLGKSLFLIECSADGCYILLPSFPAHTADGVLWWWDELTSSGQFIMLRVTKKGMKTVGASGTSWSPSPFIVRCQTPARIIYIMPWWTLTFLSPWGVGQFTLRAHSIHLLLPSKYIFIIVAWPADISMAIDMFIWDIWCPYIIAGNTKGIIIC